MLRVYHASVLPLLGRKGGEGLSRYRKEKLARINGPRAYARSLGAELLLAAALQELGGPMPPLEISRGEGGKPIIAGGPEFSLSHSGERVLCCGLVWFVLVVGSGIAGVHLDSFTVRVLSDGRARIDGSNAKLWYAISDGYVMAVCSDAYAAPETVRELIP